MARSSLSAASRLLAASQETNASMKKPIMPNVFIGALMVEARYAISALQMVANRKLAGGIRWDKHWRNKSRNGNHVDDMTFTAFEHMRKHRACDLHHADEIDIYQNIICQSQFNFGWENVNWKKLL